MSSKRSKTDFPAPSKKWKTLTLESKLNIIKDFDAQMKICKLAKKFELPEFTVRTIIKDKERVLGAVKNAIFILELKNNLLASRYYC